MSGIEVALEAKTRAVAIAMGPDAFLRNQCRDRRPGDDPFKPPGLVIEAPDRGEFLRVPQPRLPDGRLHDGGRAVIHLGRRREGCRSFPPCASENRAGSVKRQGAPCTTSATIASARTVAPTPGTSSNAANSNSTRPFGRAIE